MPSDYIIPARKRESPTVGGQRADQPGAREPVTVIARFLTGQARYPRTVVSLYHERSATFDCPLALVQKARFRKNAVPPSVHRAV